jgi:hypothetical protein
MTEKVYCKDCRSRNSDNIKGWCRVNTPYSIKMFPQSNNYDGECEHYKPSILKRISLFLRGLGRKVR